jgi:predicted nucleotidyltransferase
MKKDVIMSVAKKEIGLVKSLADISRILGDNASVLREHHVRELRLFGSFARGSATESSDIDLLVDYIKTISLFSHVSFAQQLEELFHRKVDLVTINALKPQIKDSILNEAFRVA